MLWALLNIVQCLLIRSRVLGALVLGRVIAGDEIMALFADEPKDIVPCFFLQEMTILVSFRVSRHVSYHRLRRGGPMRKSKAGPGAYHAVQSQMYLVFLRENR